MKKILYITNIEVPYRTSFFNILARNCKLTVLFERRESVNRNAKWTTSNVKTFEFQYLDGINIDNEHSFSLSIFKWLNKNWDVVIVGCYNSKVQLMAMMYMRLLGIPFYINLDGEPFIGSGLKGALKMFFLKGAKGYLTAGVKSGESIKTALGKKVNVHPYYFSSLTDEELKTNAAHITRREDFVLVVGQYFDYKGMDIAYRVACNDNSIKYKFVGMGKRTQLFIDHFGDIAPNVEIIPFLQKNELEEEYKHCKVMLLPTRQECWGLVVNEAASFGTPIVSTTGSGAAEEFLGDSEYQKYLAEPGNPDSLLACLKECLNADNTEYSQYLIKKSEQYSIEKSVREHLDAFNIVSTTK